MRLPIIIVVALAITAHAARAPPGWRSRHKRDGVCNDGYFMCADGVCIPEEYVCDGFPDCTTNDDENNCAKSGDGICDDYYFECSNGYCLPEFFVCDGVVDCVGGNDEENCDKSAKTDKSNEANKEDKWPWCDATLGCLDINDDWYEADKRPLNFVPHSRDSIGTRFLIHTRENRNEDTDHEVKAHQASTLDGTGFDATKPSKFIIHGFIDTGNLNWLKEFAQELLDYGDYNVFRVDWGGGSLPLYGQAAANCRVVGLEIGYLVNWMSEYYSLDPANVHLIGHSLGSHISGYAGEQIPGMGRISGLDPAGPYFTNMPSFVRLDETDAIYVDNIHTDADSIFLLGYGTEQAMGNVDFYPNSGHDQPGCDPVSIGIDMIKPGDIIGDGREMVACSHCRAIDLYRDTLKQPCPYIAHECSDYETFELGECGSCEDDNHRCSPIGIRGSEYTQKDRVNVRMYFDTDEDPPYCLYHYQIQVHTAHPKHSEDWVQGHLRVSFYGDNGNAIEDVKITKEHERFDHGRTKNFLMTSHVDLAHIVRAEFHWNYDDTLTNPGSYCWMLLCNRALYVSYVEISNLDYYPETSRLEYTVDVCEESGDNPAEIKSGKTKVFKPLDGCGVARDSGIPNNLEQY